MHPRSESLFWSPSGIENPTDKKGWLLGTFANAPAFELHRMNRNYLSKSFSWTKKCHLKPSFDVDSFMRSWRKKIREDKTCHQPTVIQGGRKEIADRFYRLNTPSLKRHLEETQTPQICRPNLGQKLRSSHKSAKRCHCKAELASDHLGQIWMWPMSLCQELRDQTRPNRARRGGRVLEIALRPVRGGQNRGQTRCTSTSTPCRPCTPHSGPWSSPVRASCHRDLFCCCYSWKWIISLATDLVVTPRCPAWQSHLLDPW